MRRERRNFSGLEKMALPREHLIDKVPVSEICEKHGLNPTLFYQWQKKLFEEGAAVFEQPRANGIEPGAYMFPCAGPMKAMGSLEMVEKLKRGPVGWLTVVPSGGLNIGKSLVYWFEFSLLVGVLVAYVGWHALGAGAGYRTVFRVTGTAAILGYAIGHFHDSIWKGVRWGTTAKFVFDGVVYGLVTAGALGWLWPKAA